MKAVVLTGLRQMELRGVPEPKIEKDTDVLLKIEMVGVCGSDVHYYETGRIGEQIVEYPLLWAMNALRRLRPWVNRLPTLKSATP